MPSAIRVVTRLRDQDDVATPTGADNGKVYAYNTGTGRFDLATVLTSATGYLPLTGGNLTGNLTQDNGLYFQTDEVRARDSGGLLLRDDGANLGILIADLGAVLINTSTALTGFLGAAQMQIDKTTDGALLIHRESADANGPTFEFLKRRSAFTTVSSGDRTGTIQWSAADNVDAAPVASIYAEVDGTPSPNDMPGRLVFATTADGANVVTEAFRINNSQNIIVADGKRIEVDEVRARDAGGLFLRDNSGPTGIFVQNGGAVLVNTTTAITGFLGPAQVEIDRALAGSMLMVVDSATAGTGPTLELLRRRTAFGVLSSGDRTGTILFSGADSVDAAPVAQIAAEVDGTPGSNDMPGRLVFSTTADGANAVTEAFRITNAQVLQMASGKRIESPEVRALSGGTLLLKDGSGNLGAAVINGGAVLFGTTSNIAGFIATPQTLLYGSTLGNLMLVTDNTTAATGPTIELLRRRSAFGVLSSGDRVGTILFSGADSVDAAPAAQIYAEVDGTPGSNDMPGRLLFGTTADGANAITESFRINASQNVILADGKRIEADEVRARDTGGLFLRNNAGSAGIFVNDSGQVGVGTSSPAVAFTLDGVGRVRQAGNTRYRFDFNVDSGVVEFNAFDDTGVVYIPFKLVGSYVALSVSGSVNNSLYMITNGNLGLRTASEFGGGQGVFGLADATAPTTNPSGGGILYSASGAGKWRGSSGTVTTFGPAEPHCPVCGSDYAVEYENEKYGYFSMCLKCLADFLGDKPWIIRRPLEN